MFSSFGREEQIQKMSEMDFDLVIIGGGITGCGIALDAAVRGLKVALIEKLDFSWGTSSRSTKLIHGGLRYLKQFEVMLVREVGMERAIVHRNARHVVTPEKMLLPIVEGGSLGKFMTSLGLWVYDFLAGVEADERRKMLNKEQTIQTEPLVRTDILKGGGLYYEYRTDDSRLTLEVIKTAVEKGAFAVNYARADSFLYDEKKQINGVVFTDTFTEKQYTLKAKYVVNACGPWVDSVRLLDTADPVNANPPKKLHLTKGVHIVVPYEKLPLKHSVYFDVPADGRMIFAIPRGKITYIGTTDTNYKGSTDRPTATEEDATYILNSANAMFPSVHLTLQDIESSWAGLRPLIHEAGKDPSELSRKDEIFYSSSGLISMAGGKLTGYRKMAERITDVVCKKLNVQKSGSTKNLRLTGGQFEKQEEVARFIQQRIGEAKQANVPADVVRDWVSKYGTNTDIIIEKVYEWSRSGDSIQDCLTKAEMWYCIHYEMCHTLCDYFIRRTGKLYFEKPKLLETYRHQASIMAELQGWSEERLGKEIENVRCEISAHKNNICIPTFPKND